MASSYCDNCLKAEVRRHKQKVAIGEILPVRECARCFRVFVPATRRSSCCSRTCQLAWNERVRAGGQGRRSDLVACRGCGVPCRKAYGRCRRCMDAARQGNHRDALKRRRERVVQSGDRGIDWRSVGVRDGWVCHLCGGEVLRVAGVADEPWGATVDHLVPVVEGGLHVWGNVALAHRRCNISRGVRPVEVVRVVE